MKKMYMWLSIFFVIITLPLFVYSFMCTKYGTPSDWMSGLGTLLAVIVALYLSDKVETPSIDFEVKELGDGRHEIKIKNNERYSVRLKLLNIDPKYIKIGKNTYNEDIGVVLGPCGMTYMIDSDYENYDPKFIEIVTLSDKISYKKIYLFDRISKKKFKVKLH